MPNANAIQSSTLFESAFHTPRLHMSVASSSCLGSGLAGYLHITRDNAREYMQRLVREGMLTKVHPTYVRIQAVCTIRFPRSPAYHPDREVEPLCLLIIAPLFPNIADNEMAGLTRSGFGRRRNQATDTSDSSISLSSHPFLKHVPVACRLLIACVFCGHRSHHPSFPQDSNHRYHRIDPPHARTAMDSHRAYNECGSGGDAVGIGDGIGDGHMPSSQAWRAKSDCPFSTNTQCLDQVRPLVCVCVCVRGDRRSSRLLERALLLPAVFAKQSLL